MGGETGEKHAGVYTYKLAGRLLAHNKAALAKLNIIRGVGLTMVKLQISSPSNECGHVWVSWQVTHTCNTDWAGPCWVGR